MLRGPHRSNRAIALLVLAALTSCACSARVREPNGAAGSDITSEAPIVIGGPDTTAVADDSIPVKIERLPDLDYRQLRVTGILHPRTQVIRDSVSWSKAWSDLHHIRRPHPPVPRVDFSRHMLLLVALGRRAVTGYAVEITGAYVRSDTLHVGVQYVCAESPPLEQRLNVPGAPYLVMYRGDTPNADELTSELERRYGFTSTYRFRTIKGFAAALPDGVPEVLRAHPAVQHVELDQLGSIGQTYERYEGSLGGESSPVDAVRVPRLDREVIFRPRPAQACA